MCLREMRESTSRRSSLEEVHEVAPVRQGTPQKMLVFRASALARFWCRRPWAQAPGGRCDSLLVQGASRTPRLKPQTAATPERDTKPQPETEREKWESGPRLAARYSGRRPFCWTPKCHVWTLTLRPVLTVSSSRQSDEARR